MVPDEREQKLLKLAEAIADGVPVDWARAVEADPDSSDQLEALRVLESVGATYEASDDDRTLQAGSMWGRLRIIQKIGEGAFGEIYRAFDSDLNREVALKLIRGKRAKRERTSRRFLDEARKLAQVSHPNVLVVHGADDRDGRLGMWTDFVEGQTLEQALEHLGPLSGAEAAMIGIDLCRALAAVHAQGFVHRDVKTHNVMRETGGRILLMDFGSVGESSPAGGGDESPYGTPMAVAPEVLRGEAASRRSDIYSLGVLLYRIVSGRYPVEAGTFAELLLKHERGVRVPLRDARPDLRTDFVQVVERALDPDPARRFSSAGEMESALAACLVSHRPTPPAPVPWRPLAIAAAVLVVVAVFVALRVTTAPPPTNRRGPPPASTTPVLTASASLFRESKGLAEPLPSGGRIAPGDALYLELSSDSPLNAYVLNEDEAGHVFVLFPLPGLDLQNPLPPGTRHRLPGTRNGIHENWEVTSPGGSEDVCVIASREPLEALDRELAALPRAKPGATVEYRELSPHAVSTLRGIGGTETSTAQPAAGSNRLADLLASISRNPQRLKDIWIWSTRLENPASR